MSVVVPRASITRIAAAADPKEEILKQLGNLDGFHIMGDMALVAHHIRAEKTKGGIIRPDSNVEEDIWQGKVGLLVKVGTTAFADTSDFSFAQADVPDIHDWVVFKVGDAWQLQVNGVPCRLVRDVNIRGIVEDPNIIF